MNSHVFTSLISRNNIFLFLVDRITDLMDWRLEKTVADKNCYKHLM